MTDQQRDAAWAAVHRPETSSEELGRIAEAHPEFGAAIQAHPNAHVAGVSATQHAWSAATTADEASQVVVAPDAGFSAPNAAAAPGTPGSPAEPGGRETTGAYAAPGDPAAAGAYAAPGDPAAAGAYAAPGTYPNAAAAPGTLGSPAAPGGHAAAGAYAAPGTYPNAGAYPTQQGTSASTATGGRLNVFGIIALAILVVQALTSVYLPVVMSRLAYDLGLPIAGTSLIFGAINLVGILIVGGFALAGVLQKQATRMRWTAVSALVSCGLGLLSLIASLFSGMLAPLFY